MFGIYHRMRFRCARSSRVSVKLTEEIADYVQNICCIGQILLILSSKKVKIGHNYEVYRTFTA